VHLFRCVRTAVECSAAEILEKEIALGPELLEVESSKNAADRLQAGTADLVGPKAGETKLRLAVRSSSVGSSRPETGGFSGLSTGAFWPKAGAGVVAG
jgi:hypothetical protein